MRFAVLSLLSLTLLSVVGCESSSKPTTQPSALSGQHDCCKAECLVCKKNADLACVDVKMTDKTPRTDYNGKTYFFCSDECKTEFAKNPGKYTK